MNKIILVCLVCLSFGVCKAEEKQATYDLKGEYTDKDYICNKGEACWREPVEWFNPEPEEWITSTQTVKQVMYEHRQRLLAEELTFNSLVHSCEEDLETLSYGNQKEVSYIHVGKNIELTFTGCKIKKYREEVK